MNFKGRLVFESETKLETAHQKTYNWILSKIFYEK